MPKQWNTIRSRGFEQGVRDRLAGRILAPCPHRYELAKLERQLPRYRAWCAGWLLGWSGRHVV